MSAAIGPPEGYAPAEVLTAGDLAPFLREAPQAPAEPVVRIYRPKPGTGIAARLIEILPGTVAGEFHRTRGHARSFCETSHMTWPALVRVLEGEGVLWLQRASLAPEAVSDFLVAPVRAGQAAVALPDFAAGLVNTGGATLWVEVHESRASVHDHAPVRAFQGPAYYPVAREGVLSWVPNVRYAELPTPRWIEPRESEPLGLRFQMPDEVTEETHPWLVHPEDLVQDLGTAYEYLDLG